MLKRRIGSAFVFLGVVLMLSALLLFLYNRRESDQAGMASDRALTVMQAQLESNRQSTDPEETESETLPESETEDATEPWTTLKVVTVDGYDYVGYLTIPSLELELPIMSNWSMEQLKIAPCIQTGSPLTDDVVIAGHNFRTHFAALHHIKTGAALTFADMEGHRIDYTVTKVETVAPNSVDRVLNSDHDMVLYTCTNAGQARIAVFCDRTEAEPEE